MKKIIVYLLALAVICGSYFNIPDLFGADSEVANKQYDVLSVIDGDTFVIMYQNKKTKVRMIGIDTPESVHQNSSKNTKWGKEASKYTKKQLYGKKVRLSFDVGKQDQYGRLLAYVYIGNTMYNQKLVSKGYARAVCYEPNHKYKKIFNQLQKKAKSNKKGFWADGYKVAFPN